MSNRDSNYSARERVVHKLTGAAYQMTFCEEYDRAMGTMKEAIEFWESTRDEPLDDVQAAQVYENEAVADGPQLKVPSSDSKSRRALVAMLNAHENGEAWITPNDINKYGASSQLKQFTSTLKQNYDYVQWRKTDKGHHEYRIDPHVRDELSEIL